MRPYAADNDDSMYLTSHIWCQSNGLHSSVSTGQGHPLAIRWRLPTLLPMRNCSANGAATPATEADLTSPKAEQGPEDDTMNLTSLASALAIVAQVTLNQDVDTLASALVIETQATTVANHLVFEAAARTVRTEARTILANPNLLPTEHRAAYVSMLNDFITVANMLQPGAHYGTTPQDYTAWYTALRASNITIA
jgi:hypothetical protein